jgi:hypothetical protein
MEPKHRNTADVGTQVNPHDLQWVDVGVHDVLDLGYEFAVGALPRIQEFEFVIASCPISLAAVMQESICTKVAKVQYACIMLT